MAKRVEVIDMGRTVLCDMCGKDYTGSGQRGGFLFGDKAVCPDCAPRLEESAIKFKEQHFITQRCPADMSFFAWVVEVLRGGQPATSTITNFDTLQEMLDHIKKERGE